MCIDQEMSKEKDSKSKQKPINVVAKLMGLDTLPKGEPNSIREQITYKDGYEIWLQSQKANADVDEEKMALIRRKFMEAKRLSMDERLRKSKQFGDALEVLSSNSDLLVRFLDSQKLYELPSTPPDESKRITLVKPLKMVDNDKYAAAKGKKSDRLIKKPTNTDQATIWQNRKIPEYSLESPKFDDFSVQSTLIVLLKPSPGRTHEIKSPQSFYQGNGDDDELESIKVAKEITKQMQEGLRSYQKDKTLHSSVFSNGYSSDHESSFDKSSYHEYAAEKLSDLEAMSPLTRHSWDCINGCRSPYSTVSLGRASCSPESSVCIEAKKRLSERWTMITSNDKGHHQEQRHLKRSSTLGEMLSLSLAKKSKDQEQSKSFSCSPSLNEEMSIDGNSVAESTTDEKTHGSKVLAKSKSTKSSFKGKVASFLFSRNKKSTKKKSSSSQSKDELQSTVTETSVQPANDVSQGLNVGGGFEECSLAALCESSGKTSTDSEPVSKPVAPEISISVLESPFDDYNNTTHVGSHSGVALKSKLIDKSPPIESIARTLLSWYDSCEDVANHYPLKLKRVSSLDTTTNIEEKEWFILVQKLVSAAGLDDEEEYNNRWYSIESPLDPSLRDTYANMNEKDTQVHNEAKRRKIRSKQKLVFDCVNDVLLEVVGYGSENYYFKRPSVQKGTLLSPFLVDHIMAQMKELIANGMRWENCGDSHSIVVENVVRKEVMQIGWVELMKLEIDILGREIEGMLIEELVENAVIDFIA